MQFHYGELVLTSNWKPLCIHYTWQAAVWAFAGIKTVITHPTSTRRRSNCKHAHEPCALIPLHVCWNLWSWDRLQGQGDSAVGQQLGVHAGVP